MDNPADHIGRLADVLHVPDDLIAFYRVVEQFQPVWERYLDISEPAQRQSLDAITATIEAAVTGQLQLAERFPKSVLKPPACTSSGTLSPKSRVTLTGYYGTHPWYGVFWHESARSSFEPQYRALLASVLPAFVKLEATKGADHRLNREADTLGRTLRQLTDPQEAQEAAFLVNFPLTALPPADLNEWIRSFCQARGYKTATPLGRRLSHLVRVLEWFQTDHWPSRDLFRKSSAPTGRASPQHGAIGKVETEAPSHAVFQAESGASLSVTTWRTAGNQDGEEDPVGDDHDPSSDAAETAATLRLTTSIAVTRHRADRQRVAARAARFAAQAIEMTAQHLPVTRSTLTGHDLNVLFGALENPEGPAWSRIPLPRRAMTATWLTALFYLSRDASELKELRKAGTRGAATWPSIDQPAGQCLLPIRSPRHHSPQTSNLLAFLEPTSQLVITLPARFKRVLQSAPVHRGRYFPDGEPPEAASLLTELNRQHGTQLTAHRITEYIASTMRQLGPSDQVYAIYFSGHPPNQHNPAVYSGVPVPRIQELYRQACGRADALAGMMVQESTPELPTLGGDEQTMVGSRHVPTVSAVRTFLDRLYGKVDHLRLNAHPVQLIHNRFTAFTALMVLALTGIRATRHGPSLAFDIDRATSLAFVSEKDNAGYTNARLVWLHPILLEQLDAYARHETRLRQFLALTDPEMLRGIDARGHIGLLSAHTRPNRDEDNRACAQSTALVYFLDRNGLSTLPLERALIGEHLDEPGWLRHLGILRHFLRTNLLLRACSGEIINAQFGHADRGQFAWGPFSSLPPAAWRATLGHHIDALAREVGLRALQSPLLARDHG